MTAKKKHIKKEAWEIILTIAEIIIFTAIMFLLEKLFFSSYGEYIIYCSLGAGAFIFLLSGGLAVYLIRYMHRNKKTMLKAQYALGAAAAFLLSVFIIFGMYRICISLSDMFTGTETLELTGCSTRIDKTGGKVRSRLKKLHGISNGAEYDLNITGIDDESFSHIRGSRLTVYYYPKTKTVKRIEFITEK